MDPRYKSPAMRQKMAPSDPPSPMDETPDKTMDANSDSKPTAFLPKELGGGKVWKPGDEIVLTIDAVDPETGEMQVSYAPEKPGSSDEDAESGGAMDSFDKSMPSEDNEGY